MTWDERTVRGNPARLRNLRVLHEEVGLLLEELTQMADGERLAAHDHQQTLARLLERMREKVGPLGPDPVRTEERIRAMVREHTTNGRGP